MAKAPSLVTTPLLPTASWTETRPSVAGFRIDDLRHDGVNMTRECNHFDSAFRYDRQIGI